MPFRILPLVFAVAMVTFIALRPQAAYGVTFEPVAGSADSVSPNAICSLREAVLSARDGAAAPAAALADCGQGSDSTLDTIRLQKGGTYTITAAAGQLLVNIGNGSGPLEIRCHPLNDCSGAAGDHAVISGPGANTRLIMNAGGGDATFRFIELTGGSYTEGGAIYNAGTMTLDRVLVNDNDTTSGNGGGIFNNGTLTITNSRISNNSAVGDGGGILNDSTLNITGSFIELNDGGQGGGIATSEAISIDSTEITDNEASTAGGGVFGSHAGAAITLQGASVIAGNNSGTDGAGIFSLGSLTVTLSAVQDNIAGGFGGGINAKGALTVSLSRIEGNQAADHPGISAAGTTTIDRTTIDNNDTASGTGGGLNLSSTGSATITSSTISNNG